MEALKNTIIALLEKKLKGKFAFNVILQNDAIGTGKYLKIWIACSNIDINRVAGQKPQVVSLMLSDKLELHPQVFGGCGGQSIHRKPNLQDPSEQYLAMKRVKIPFRTPVKTEDKVIQCLEKFVDNYIKALKENIEVLTNQDIVDYKELLKDF